MKIFSWDALTSFSSLVAIVIEGLTIWGSKYHQNNPPVVFDGYVKYDEAEVDRLVTILKTNSPPRRGLLNNIKYTYLTKK